MSLPVLITVMYIHPV